jgi:hypothetical protein
MKKSILVVCGVFALAGATAAAQESSKPPTPTQQMPPTPSPAQRPPDPLEQRPPNPDRPIPNTPPPDAPRPMADVSNSTTVTGCVKTWDSRTVAPATGAGSGGGSAATASGSSKPSEFVLMNVEGSNKGSYLLRTSDASVSFVSHLNHRVSVTGTVADAAKDMGRGSDRSNDQPTADKPATDRDASASGRVSAGDAKLPILNVTALKMLSPTCGS